MFIGKGWALPPLGLLLAIAAFNGCSSDDNNDSPPPDGGRDTGTSADTGAPATFTEAYAVISARCLTCHIPGGSGVNFGKLDLSTADTAFANLVTNPAATGVACANNGKPRVTPGNADQSIFYLKVSLDDPTPCGNKMPEPSPADGGPPEHPLTQEQADTIQSWINAGANHN